MFLAAALTGGKLAKEKMSKAEERDRNAYTSLYWDAVRRRAESAEGEWYELMILSYLILQPPFAAPISSLFIIYIPMCTVYTHSL